MAGKLWQALGNGFVDGVAGISGGEVGGMPIGSVPGLGTCSGDGAGSSGGRSGCGGAYPT
jgi:hypothetical protein